MLINCIAVNICVSITIFITTMLYKYGRSWKSIFTTSIKSAINEIIGTKEKEFDFAKKMARVEKTRESFFQDNPKARVLYDLVEMNPKNYSGYGWSAWNSLKLMGYLNYAQIKMLDEYLLTLGI